MTTSIQIFAPDPQFRKLVAARFAEPVAMPSYTIAGLPAAASWAGSIVYLSNGASNQRIAVSDGTIWRYASGVAV